MSYSYHNLFVFALKICSRNINIYIYVSLGYTGAKRGLSCEYNYDNCCATSVSMHYLNKKVAPVRQIWAGRNLISSSVFEISKFGLTDLFLSSIRALLPEG